MKLLPLSKTILNSLTSHLKTAGETRVIIRTLSTRKPEHFSPELPPENVEKGPKYRQKTLDFKQKINVFDTAGKSLGLKTKQEAQQIANKNNWILMPDDTTKKVPSYKFVDLREVQRTETILEKHNLEESHRLGVEDDQDNSDAISAVRKERTVKQLLFSDKLADHDLTIKINQIKKWVSRGHETVVRVDSVTNNPEKLRSIDRILEKNFNRPEFGVKINQRRLTEHFLKMNIIPFDPELSKNILDTEPPNK